MTPMPQCGEGEGKRRNKASGSSNTQLSHLISNKTKQNIKHVYEIFLTWNYLKYYVLKVQYCVEHTVFCNRSGLGEDRASGITFN